MKTTTTARANGTTSRGRRRFVFHPHLLRKEEAHCFQRKEEANCQLDMRVEGARGRTTASARPISRTSATAKPVTAKGGSCDGGAGGS